MDPEPTVLVVDDDPAVLASVEALFRAHGLAPRCFASAEEFLANFRGDGPGCLVTDLRLPGLSGLELHLRLQASGSPLSVILVTGTADLSAGVPPEHRDLTILEKPYTSADLIHIVRQALAQSRERRQNAHQACIPPGAVPG